MPARAVVSRLASLGVALLLFAGVLSVWPSPGPASAGAEAGAAGRTWVVDAVDDASGNRWESADTGTTDVRIGVGDTVEWQFDRAEIGHDLTSQDVYTPWPEPLEEYRAPGEEPVRYTFDEPGTYYFECSLHGTVMTGRVIVEEAGANTAPTGTASADPTTGVAPLAVHFMAAVTDPDGDPLAYAWDFGTGDPADVAESAHASFTYTEPGSYTATLGVEDGRGGVLTRQMQVVVGSSDAPVVSATATPASGAAPLEVDFSGEATDAQGGPLTWEWDFGVPGTDGDTAVGPDATYTYPAAGSYTATLAVTDEDGHVGTDTVEVEVSDGPAELPAIAALAERAAGADPLAVEFGTEVTTTGVFAPLTLVDGSTPYPDLAGSATLVRSRGATTATIDLTGAAASALHPVHVHEQACTDGRGGAHFRFDESKPFEEPNELWPEFTSNAAGESGPVVEGKPMRAGPKAVSIVVHNPSDPAQRIGCADLGPSVEGLTYLWSFGDGETATGPDPDHTYAEPGDYRATVTVTAPGADPVSSAVRVDLLAPRTSIASGPRGAVGAATARFRLGSSEAGGRYECRLDDLPWTACAREVVLRRLADGVHRLRVRAVDSAGNRDASPVVRTWTVDTAAPTVRRVGPQGVSRDRRPTVRARVVDALSPAGALRIVLTIDGRRVAVRVTARGAVTGTPAAALAPGRHVARLIATDAVGNRSTRSWQFTVRR